MTVKILQPPKEFNEALMLASLGLYLDYRQNECFPNVGLFSWESDMLVVTKSKLVWEIETKVTLADWKADAAKDKWMAKDWHKISRFYYAVPAKLVVHKDQSRWYDPTAQSTSFHVPDFVPAWAGVLALSPDYRGRFHIQVVRAPKMLGSYKITDSEMRRLYRSAYFRYWNTRPGLEQAMEFIDLSGSTPAEDLGEI